MAISKRSINFNANMTYLVPIGYNRRRYPPGIWPGLEHVAGHFDIEIVNCSNPFCLHTEYSYAARKLNSNILSGFPIIKDSCKDNIPQLWFNKKWSEEFFSFILAIMKKRKELLRIIEIHPPFNDYCNSLDHFIDIYSIFEDMVIDEFDDVEILIENRSGSTYKGGRFLVTTTSDIIELCSVIDRKGVRLRVVLDCIQLLTSHRKKSELSPKDIISVLLPLKKCGAFIDGLHVWGKKRSQSSRLVSHIGDLNSYFGYDAERKRCFTETLFDVFNDGHKRYFVPEVNSGSGDLQSIVNDLMFSGFSFISF